MANIGDIRRAAMGAARTQREFERAVTGIRNRMIRAVQVAGREVYKRMYTRYGQGFYVNKAGKVVRIKPYGAEWGAMKQALKLDMRPGVARKGILKTIRSPLGFIKRSNGFDIDLTRPNLTITGRARVKAKANSRDKKGRFLKGAAGVRGSFVVNEYIGAFADEKAPGLGNIADRDVAFIRAAANKAASDFIARVRGASKRALTGKALAKITLRLDRMTG